VRTVLEQSEQAQYAKVNHGPIGDNRQRSAVLDSLEQAIKTTPKAR
jgi:hypothetical protein